MNEISNRLFRVIIACQVVLTSCKNDNNRSVQIDKFTIAEGDISSDTNFNGSIKFLHAETRAIKRENNYLNNVLHGPSIEYYNTGQVSSISIYDHGKLHGPLKVFNRNGKLEREIMYYQDLKGGGEIGYSDSVFKTYKFYSFDNKRLMDLDYDSISKKAITESIKEFFFFYLRSFEEHGKIESKQHNELFIYLPNPPNYNFRYSLVLLEPDYTVDSIIKIFSRDRIWEEFIIPIRFTDLAGRELAFQLEILDPVVGDITLYKKISRF